MKIYSLRKFMMCVLLMIAWQHTFAQKLLDPSASSGPLSIAVASSGGSNTSMAVAYSVRQLKTTYDHAAITAPSAVSGFTNSTTPLMRVRRSSDNEQLDIGYLASGMLDTVTLKSFVGSGSGFISVWYDQSGNSRDATQATTSSQPRIVNSGVLDVNANGVPGMMIVNGQYIQDAAVANRYGITGDRTMNVICQPKAYVNAGVTTGGGTYVLDRNLASGGNPLTSIKTSSDKWGLQIRNDAGAGLTNSYEGTIVVNTGRTDNLIIVRSGDAYSLEVNGVSAGTNGLSGTNTMDALKMGYGGAITESVYYGEVILFGSALSATNKYALYTSQNKFFSVGGTYTWTGGTSTDWNTASNWNNNNIPSEAASVIVPSGTTNALTITAAQTTLKVFKFTVNSGATVTINGNLYVTDSVNANGTIAGSGTLTLSGIYPQKIKGTFSNLSNSNTTETVSASGDITVNGTLTNPAAGKIDFLYSNFYNSSGTVSNSGNIYTRSFANPPLPTGKTWGGTVTYTGTTGSRYIVAGTYNNLVMSNVSDTNTATGNITINGALTTTAGGIFSMSTYALSGSLTSITSPGTISTANTSATPLPTGKTWGGTVEYNAGTAQTVSNGTYNNLTLTSGTKTAGGDLVVNGTLMKDNMTLDMGTYSLSGTLAISNNNAEIRTANTSANPLPSGIFWGTAGWVTYNAATGGQTIVGGGYIHLNLANTSGTQTASGNIAVDQTFIIPAGTILNMQTYTLSGTISSLQNSGTIQTAVTSAPFPTGRTWSGTISYNAPTGGQTIMSNATYTNLTIGNTSGTQTPDGNLTVNGTLTTTAGGTLSMGTNTFSGTLATTVTNNGTISTTNTTATPLPSGKTWGGTGTVQYAVTTGAQTVVAGTYNSILLSNTSGTNTAAGDIGLNGTLTTQSGGTFNLTTFQLTGTSGSISNSGTIKTANTANPPLPNGKIWAGTVEYYASATQTVSNGTYNNLTVNNGTKNAAGDLVINGAFTIPISAVLNMGVYALSGTLSSINISSAGGIQTANTSANPLPSGKFWGTAGAILYNAATGGQTVVSGTYTYFRVSNTSGTQTANGNISIDQTFVVDAGGTLNMGTYTLSGNMSSLIQVSGTIQTAVLSGPFPTGKTWGGTINYNAPTGGQTIISNATYNNLTMGNTSGTQTPDGNLTVNGTLTTTAGGKLSMGTNTFAGALATITNDGTISTGNTTATPLPSAKTWGGTGTVQYAATTGAQTIVAGTYYSILLSNTSGTNTAAGTISLGGTLTTQSGGTFDLTTFQITVTGTISNSGTIKTANTSTTPLPASKTWGGTVEYYATTGGQTVAGGTYNNLTTSNTSGTQTAGSGLVVDGALTTVGGSTLDMGTYVLSGTLNTINNGGAVLTSNTSANPIPSGKTWGSIVSYNATTGGQTIANGTYGNLYLTNTSGTQTASGNLSAQALSIATGGTLDLATYTLGGTLTSITNNGTIKTANTSTTPLPSAKTWGGTVEYYATTGGQTVAGGTYNNLTTGNTSGTGTANGNISVSGILTTTAGGTFDLSTNTLSGTLTTITNNGTLKISNTSSTPVPANKTWGGTGPVQYAAASGAQTVIRGTYNYLQIANTSGTNTVSGDLVVNTTFSTTAGGTTNMGTALLFGASMAIDHNGTLLTASTSATALPTGKTWGGTVNYNAAAGGQTIFTGTYNNLTLSNTSGNQTATSTVTVNGALSTTAGGTFLMNSNQLAGAMTSVSHSGTIRTANSLAAPIPVGKTWGGTVEFFTLTGGQTVVQGTYNNLTIGNTSATTTAGGNLVVDGTLITSSGGTFSLSTYTLSGSLATITNNGTISTANTSGTPVPTGKTWGGAVNYNAATGGQTVVSATSYNNLTMGNTSGTQTTAVNLVVNGILTTTAGGTLDMGTNTLGGTLTTITHNGTIKTANTSATPLPSGKTWGGTGTVQYAATTGAQTIVAGTYYTILLSNTSGTNTAAGTISLGGTLTTQSGGTFDLTTFQITVTGTISNGGTIKTANTSTTPLPASKTWGGTVEYYATTGGQTVAGGTYNNLTTSNTSGTQTAGGGLVVDGTLTTVGGSTLDMGTYVLSGILNTINNGGTVLTSNTSANPIPSGKTWGSIVSYNATTGGQTIANGTYANLYLTNTSGTQTASGNLSAQALSIATGGTLDLATYTLGGTLTSITNNGTIKTACIVNPPLPSGKTWPGAVEYTATGGAQTISGGTYNTLTIKNTSGTNTAEGAITINGTFTAVAGAGIFNMGTFQLIGTAAAVSINMSLRTACTINPPLPVGETWVSPVTYNAATGAQTIAEGSYDVLNSTNTSGINTAGGNLSISTTLSQSGSSATIDMSTYQLSGAFTPSVFGTLRTANTSATPVPAGKTWGGTVEYYTAAGTQTIMNGTYNSLTLANSSGTNTAAGNLVVNGTLTTTANGTLEMGTNVLSGGTTTVTSNGIIRTANTSAAPIPSLKTWGGTVTYYATTGAQTIANGTYNNLLMSNTSGTQSLNGTTTIGATMTFSGGKLALGSNTLNINGTLSGHSSTNTFIANGSSNMSIGGSGALGSSLYLDQTTPGTTNRLTDFTYNRSSQTITLGSALQVIGTVTPTAGTLATGGLLTLTSNASATGRIAAGTGSYITGNVTAERYIPSVARRWRFMASPVTGSTLADWQNEIYITGAGGAANGFDATLSNAAGVASYNESVAGEFNANGWVFPANISTALTPGKGFRVFIRGDRSDPGVLTNSTGTQAAVTMNAIGSVNTGNITMPVSYTNSGVTANDGWSFLGNPYPSPIDWNAFHDAGRTGSSPDYSGTDYAHLDAVASVLDANTNSYASYNAASNIGTGVFSNGIIPSGGSFWVKATASSPFMTMKEIYKTGSTPAAMFKTEGTQPVFSLKLSKDDITSDEMVIRYMNEANANFDLYDIAKLNGEVNISSVTENGTLLTGNCKPFNGISDSIELNITVAKSGNYFIEAANVQQLVPGKNIYLVDAFTHAVIDLNARSRYDFAIDKDNAASKGNNRFMVVVGNAKPVETGINEQVTANNNISVYPAFTNGEITISNTVSSNEPVSILITDAAGREVNKIENMEWNNNTLKLDLSSNKTGIYFITVQSASVHAVLKCLKY